MQNLIVTNNIIFNNLTAAVRTGKEQISKLPTGEKVRFKLTAGICPEFSEFDLAVYSYMCSIWDDEDNPDNTFSITAMCRTLGCSSSGGISPVIRQEAVRSIGRLCAVRLGMDAESEFNLHPGFLDGDPKNTWDQAAGVRWKSGDNQLICIAKSEKTFGKPDAPGAWTETIYQITAEPLLHIYSRITGQFVTISSERFQIHEVDLNGHMLPPTLAATKPRIGMIFWLARRSEHIRYNFEHPRKKQKGMWSPKGEAKDTILLSTIFERIGLDKRSASRHKKQYLDFLTAVLNCWKAQGIIPEWKVRKNVLGRADAFVFTPGGTSSSPKAAPPESSPRGCSAAPNIVIPEGIPNANFSAEPANFSAPYASFSAGNAAAGKSETAQLSWFDALVDAVAGKLNYLNYSSTVSPAHP